MDGNTADVRPDDLDLAGVDADANVHPDPADGIPDGRSATQRSGRTAESDQESVAGRLHLDAPIAVKLRTNEPVVIPKHLFPCSVPHPAAMRVEPTMSVMSSVVTIRSCS